MHLEKLWPVISLPITILIVLFALTGKAQAFEASYYLTGGLFAQQGTLCQTIVIKQTGTTPEGKTIEFDEKYQSGYVGLADAGFYVNPFADIFMKLGYSYIGCTGEGQVIQGGTAGLQVGRQGYISLDAIYDKPEDENPDEERTEIAYKLGIGGMISKAVSVNFYAVKDTYEDITYLVGFQIHL